jgi:hypothetical protein
MNLDGLSKWIVERFRRHAGNADVVRQACAQVTRKASEKGLVVSLRTVEQTTARLRRDKLARCDRLSGLAQSVIDQPQAFTVAKRGGAHVSPPPDLGHPDCRIEQPPRGIPMRQIGPLVRPLPPELADHIRQSSPFVA